MKTILQPLKVITLALILSVGISYVSAWTAPSATPPSSNVATPVNVSSTAQIKTGDFSAWNLISNGVVTNNAVVTNSIAGNTVATNNLVVATGAAAGKVLTSDATGNATWQTAGNSGMVITDIEVQGTACSVLGAIAQDGTGSPLFCSYGSWRAATLSGFPGYSNFNYGAWSATVPTGSQFAIVSVYGAGGGGTASVADPCTNGVSGNAGGKAWIKIPVTGGQILSGNNSSVVGKGAYYAGGTNASGTVTFPAYSLIAYGGLGGNSGSTSGGTASGGTVVVGGGSAGGAGGPCITGSVVSQSGYDGSMGGVRISYSVN